MSSFELQHKVIQALSRQGHGSTAEEVLSTCQLLAQAESILSKQELESIRSKVGLSHQTWKRMVSVSKNSLLWENRSALPANFSTLYRLSLLKDSALKEGVEDGTINISITTREVETLKKNVDIRARYKTSKRSIYLFCKNELDDFAFARLISRVNEIASEFNACFDTQDLAVIQQENNKRMFDVRRQMIESSIDHEISMLASPAAIHDGIFFSSEVRDRIKRIPLGMSFGEFVKTIKSFTKNREEMMRSFGQLYCLKLGQEYCKTDSRAQRYNCKKRLIEVQSLYPQHAKFAKRVLDSLTQADVCETEAADSSEGFLVPLGDGRGHP